MKHITLIALAATLTQIGCSKETENRLAAAVENASKSESQRRREEAERQEQKEKADKDARRERISRDVLARLEMDLTRDIREHFKDSESKSSATIRIAQPEITQFRDDRKYIVVKAYFALIDDNMAFRVDEVYLAKLLYTKEANFHTSEWDFVGKEASLDPNVRELLKRGIEHAFTK